MKDIISSIVGVFVIIVLFYVTSSHLSNNARIEGYKWGCKDIMVGLYKDVGIKSIDHESLNSFCEGRAKEYFKTNK